jgi:subtilisin family serine protease
MFLFAQAAKAQQLPEGADLPAAQSVKIGPGVAEELAANGAANVMIALAQPQSLQGLNTASPDRGVRPNLAALKSEIATLQRGVLSSIENIGYRPRFTYSAVPALAGRITSDAAMKALANHPNVMRVDLDVGGSGQLATSVPLIGADQRHAMGNTGLGVVVAVLDSGLDTDHSNLADNLIAEACFADADGTIDGIGNCPNGSDRQIGPGAAEDDAGHGSHVTGIITSNGTFGSVGAAPDAGIVAIRVTYGPTFNGAFSFFSEIVAALNYIIINPQLNVRVINMSLGTTALYNGNCDTSTAFNMAGATAINALRANGVIAFASAGNNGSTTQMTSPACLSNVISVGASDNADAPAVFTNSNASTDVFAPGVLVLSSNLQNGTTTVSGTSMASPHAAACAALLIQTGEATTPNQIETRLETSAFTVTVPGNGLTFPRIDCAPLANVPPTCNANGPYTAECALTTTLDGTGSSDDNGDPLSYLWTGPFTGGSAVGAMPMVVFEAPTGSKSVLLTVSDGTDSSQCSADVTVQDTLAPTVSCNAPATIVPPNAPISFTASALDQCEGPIAADITEYDCFTFTKKGKRIDKTGSCVVAIGGDQITILDSGGVGTHITWTATSTDAAGNTTTEDCALRVKRPESGKK